MEKNKDNILSKLISRVLDPVVEIPVALVLAVFWAIENGVRWRFLLLLLLVDVLLPFVFFLHLLRKGEVSNWDIRNRKERIPLYFFTLITHLVGVMLAYLLGKQSLFLILVAFYLVAVVFLVITYFWKISIHAGVNSLLVTFVNMMTGWKYWWLYFLILVVGWARVRGGHHGWKQVFAGAVLGGVGVWVGLVLVA